MNNLHNLLDAFDELEQRADAVPVRAHAEATSTPFGRRHAARVLIPAAAFAAVALPVATIVLVQQSGSSSPKLPQAAGSSQGAPAITSVHSSTTGPNERYQPPSSAADLAGQARAILAGIATIEVTDSSDPAHGDPPIKVDPNAPTATISIDPSSAAGRLAPSGGGGPSISGMLTASGQTGGFDLHAFLASPISTEATCDGGSDCTVRTLASGSSLAVGSWHDPTVAGGATYQVEVLRPDGAEIVFHLSTENDPKGQRTVTATQLPLTVEQMISFVTSERW
jgi:hypothetical protein